MSRTAKSWLNAFRHLCTRFRTRPTSRSDRYRPILEILEDRLAPASFLVTTNADSGAGSLRAAVDAANAAGGSNSITFSGAAVGATITLSSNDTNNPTLFGPTALVGRQSSFDG